ncbi:hypothetical protein [Streptosporangium sp. NPDC000396]|uniref:hypothetical protein n=1 Tax=Streptosporangium sp. NPDC000396 TaxID=3366185 RepID=UPI00367491CE
MTTIAITERIIRIVVTWRRPRSVAKMMARIVPLAMSAVKKGLIQRRLFSSFLEFASPLPETLWPPPVPARRLAGGFACPPVGGQPDRQPGG